MNFLLLGPIEARDGAEPIALGPPKQRALLALLVLSDRPVTVERAVDELWSDPPATAQKMVQIYASGLRKALGSDAIRTTRTGYELMRNGADVDVERFRELREDARRAGPRAAALLRAAEALWRGDALADLVGEPFAERARARLEEERTAAYEERVHAELQSGASVDIGELEAHIASDPYREPLRGLLMRTHYRAGRQAAALKAYQDAARVLRDELGLEPSRELRELEQAILRQETGLEPSPPPAADAPSRRRTRRAVVVAGGVLVIALAVLGGAGLLARSGSERPIGANSAVALDAASGDVVLRVPTGLRPTAIATQKGRVFVANGEDQTVSMFDALTGRRISSTPVGASLTSLSAGGGDLWGAWFLGREVVRMSAAGDGAPLTIPLRQELGHPAAVAATPNGAWVGTDAGSILFISAAGRVEPWGSVEFPIRAIAYAPPFLWLATGPHRNMNGEEQAGKTVRFDIRNHSATTTLVGHDPSAIEVGPTGVWVADEGDGRVELLDQTAAASAVVDLHTPSVAESPCSSGLQTSCAGSIALAGGALWVPSARDRAIYRLDVKSGRVTHIPTRGSPVAVAANAGRVWVVSD
jgi:DNA-binding SARP family transcriptional activator/DNA-binding beta-propeller fold protein YncE